MLMAALTGEAYLGRIPDFGTDPRYRPRELSPGGMERERLRQEQDAAYEESLLMDKHKEEEEERLRRAAERAAAAAAAEEARKAREAEEAAAALERSLAEKEASLPPEPGPEEGDAVVLVVRLPKGGRLSRRFRQSDRLGVSRRPPGARMYGV